MTPEEIDSALEAARQMLMNDTTLTGSARDTMLLLFVAADTLRGRLTAATAELRARRGSTPS